MTDGHPHESADAQDEQDDEERADVDEAKALTLMAKYPAMIKRPVLDTGKTLLVGFDADHYAKELKQ